MIIESKNKKYYHCRIPGIICTQKDTLLAYYECRKSDSDWAEIDIKIIRSTDKGENWNAAKIIESTGKTLNNPVMITNNGMIHLLYCENYKRIFHSVSTDDGLSFSAPVEITYAVKNVEHTVVAIGPGHGIATADGTMIVPLWFANNKDDKLSHHPSFIGTLYSKDNGNHWHTGEIIEKDFLKNPSECALALLKDDTVLMSIRNESECHLRCFAKSNNGYENWYDIDFDERFADPICQGSMTNSKNIICHINCNHKTDRKNLILKISDDDFKTFRAIEVDDYGGYSDLCLIDNTAYIIYEDTTDTDEEYFVKLEFKRIKQ